MGKNISILGALVALLSSPPSPQPQRRRFIKTSAPIGATPKRAKVKAARKQRKQK